jgi:energy-coupling factor transporter ATP-binding protein EcfA2
MLTFTPAKKDTVSLKLAVTGPSGSGKTTAALRLARGLVGPQGRIGVIDTEHRSASLYADQHTFEALNLDPPYDAPTFAEAIKSAEAQGFDALIVDTLSHAWEAVLEYKDALDRRGGSGFSNWAAAGEKWRAVISALLNSKLHVIACLRSKTDYVLEPNEKGKMVPKKVGLAPITRDGTEYEFTLVWDLDASHRAMASKDRTRLFDSKTVELTEVEGRLLAEWLKGAVASPGIPDKKSEPAPAAPASAPVPAQGITPETLAKLERYWIGLGKSPSAVPKAVQWTGCTGSTFAELTEEQAQKLVAKVQEQMNALAAQQEPATPGAGFEEPKVSPPNLSDPSPATPPAACVVPAALAEWFGANEDEVNGYLRRIKWVEPDQTWRQLAKERATAIEVRPERFARASGIPPMGGVK